MDVLDENLTSILYTITILFMFTVVVLQVIISNLPFGFIISYIKGS